MIRFDGYNIELTSGDTLFFNVNLAGRVLPEGSVAYFTVKENPKSEANVIRKKIDVIDGSIDIRLSSEDTYLPARTYYWDVRVLIPVDSGGYEVETPMEYAAFTIIDAIGFPGDDGQPPGLDENLPRLSLLIEEANELIEELKDYKVPVEQIEQIVRDYLEENPPETGVNQDEVKRVVDEAIDELPDWSKEPTPPKYTAEDVGAIPVSTKIPEKTSDLTNDSGFIAKAVSDLTNYYLKSETYTRDEINQRISAIPKFTISVVSALPTTGISETTIYLVKSGSGSDLYTEYIRVNGVWEVLGSQRVDLTGYATETWVSGQLAGYQPKGDYAFKNEIPSVPTKLSELAGDSTHRVVTDSEKATWNAKSNFSGSYKDLTDKPTIPDVPVQSVNGKTGAVTLSAADVGAATAAQFSQLSEAIEQQDETIDELKIEVAQQTPLFADSIAGCTDTTKLYVLPDGYIYHYGNGTYERRVNLNDNAYTYGRFASAGTEYNGDTPLNSSVRTSNYLPVEGGRTIVGFFAGEAWNGNMQNMPLAVVQYDENKQIIVKTTTLSNYANGNYSLALNNATKYIRFSWTNNSTASITADISTIRIAVYYIEDAVKEYRDYVSETGYGWLSTGHAFVPADYEDRIVAIEKLTVSRLKGKKIVYDGDSIAESRSNNGGGYAKIIADLTGGTYDNHAVGGGHLRSGVANRHCVVDNLTNLPTDADLYCFEGGINDFWGSATLGTYAKNDFTGAVDATTICGALETIFRYALTNFVGKPICFVIVHKIQSTAYTANSSGNTFEDYRNAMIGICQKYSIPYYDAFSESGLNGWNTAQNNAYLTANTNGTADGCHPNEDGYKRYYAPQLISLFESIMPVT